MAKKRSSKKTAREKERAAELAHVKKVFRRHAPKLRRRKGVVQVGYGLERAGGKYNFQSSRKPKLDRLAIIIYVQKKLKNDEFDDREPFPEEIDGVPLDVQTLYGTHTAPPDPDQFNPTLEGGLQISALTTVANGWGTLGLVVHSAASGEDRILTASHVAFAPGKAKNDPLFQPPGAANKVGTLLFDGLPAWDAATVRPLTPAARATAVGQIRAVGTVTGDPLTFHDLVPGTVIPVQSFGVRSWQLHGPMPMKGQIVGSFPLTVQFPPNNFSLGHLVAVAGDRGHFSESGDSGAPAAHLFEGELRFLGLVLGVESDEQGNENPAPGRHTYVQVLGSGGFDKLGITLD